MFRTDGLGCAWCDGWEHRDKPFAIMGEFSEGLVQGAVNLQTLNTDTILLTNGTYTDDAIASTTAAVPTWEKQLGLYQVGIENRTIASFARANGDFSDYSDDILITFTDGNSITRNAIKGNFPAALQSPDLLRQMGLNLTSDSEIKIAVDNYKQSTNVPGVYVVGDANS